MTAQPLEAKPPPPIENRIALLAHVAQCSRVGRLRDLGVGEGSLPRGVHATIAQVD